MYRPKRTSRNPAAVEHQVTMRVDVWDGQPVRMAQEEDMIISADGKVRWAHGRQDRSFLRAVDAIGDGCRFAAKGRAALTAAAREPGVRPGIA